MNYQKVIRDFIISNFLYGDPASLEDETSFLDSGIVDSTGILELVGFLEQQFQIKVRDEEMLPENLDSVGKVTRFVERKLVEIESAKP